MTDEPQDDQVLDTLFSAAKADAPSLSPAFLSQLQQDADAVMPEPPTGHAKPAAPGRTMPFLGNLKTVFTASGLSGAAALGVWIGLVMPDLVTNVVPALSPLSSDTVALSAFLPGADLSSLSE